MNYIAYLSCRYFWSSWDVLVVDTGKSTNWLYRESSTEHYQRTPQSRRQTRVRRHSRGPIRIYLYTYTQTLLAFKTIFLVDTVLYWQINIKTVPIRRYDSSWKYSSRVEYVFEQTAMIYSWVLISSTALKENMRLRTRKVIRSPTRFFRNSQVNHFVSYLRTWQRHCFNFWWYICDSLFNFYTNCCPSLFKVLMLLLFADVFTVDLDP